MRKKGQALNPAPGRDMGKQSRVAGQVLFNYINEGLALFGTADVSGLQDGLNLPVDIKKRLKTAVSIGYALSRSVLDTLIDGPNQLYYFHYQRVNVLLDSAALKIATALQKAGYNALPVPASQIIDWKNMTGTVSHRDVAILAGLAWHGRNNLAVNPLFGAAVRYATILTDAPLESIETGDAPKIPADGCGSCRKCIAACPAGAIGGSLSDFKIDLCIKKLKEFQKERNISHLICGMCLKACNK